MTAFQPKILTCHFFIVFFLCSVTGTMKSLRIPLSTKSSLFETFNEAGEKFQTYYPRFSTTGARIPLNNYQFYLFTGYLMFLN